MTKIDRILKSRDNTLPTKFCLVKAMVFPVVMYGCDSWTVKKAEHWRIDAFELWCWRRLLRVPWTARRSNQSILKETSPGCSLEGLMLRLKFQYFGHFIWRVDSTPGVGDGQGGLACCDSWGHKELDMTEQLNWTELKGYNILYKICSVKDKGFLSGSVVKKTRASAGDVGSILSWEDPLGKEIATHSNILAWEIPWTEKSGGL